MFKALRLPFILVILTTLWLAPVSAPDATAGAAEITPKNTVMVADQSVARLSQDYSTLLAHLRLEWVILGSGTLPEPSQEMNLILLARPDDPHAGSLMSMVLTLDEMATARATADPMVLEKESPWTAGRRVWVCSGADLLQVRDAAEEAVRTLIDQAPPTSAWVRARFDAPMDQEARATVDRLRYTWDDEELPQTDLQLEVGAKPRKRISAEEAAEDVERLFYLFAHGYSGYGFFDQDGAFDQAKARILDQLSTQSKWSSEDLALLFREQLDFITDRHTKIGDIPYAGHADFWYDTAFELTMGADGYAFTADGSLYQVASVDDRDPEDYVFPSLNAQGSPIYRLGTLSEEEPAPLQLVGVSDGGQERQFQVALGQSDYLFQSDDYFREDTVGGIPVIRVRNFGDSLAEELGEFVKTGSAHRGDPVVILDIRGNGGGNESWPIAWIQALTGRRAESVFIVSELSSKTSMMGRANLFADLYENFPDTTMFRSELERHTALATGFETGGRTPSWSGPFYPHMSLIPNDTTVVIVMNEYVASAGEGMVMRASRAENVVLVGENSMGALTFGNISYHQLPHSRLRVRIPINFNLYLDLAFREGVGIAPDLWVPAADAVNYAVAAVRAGTISTRLPLTAEQLGAPFEPEDPWSRDRKDKIVFALLDALALASGSAFALFQRRKPRLVVSMGVVWMAFSVFCLLTDKPIGFGFLLASVVGLIWGGSNLRRAKEAPEPERDS